MIKKPSNKIFKINYIMECPYCNNRGVKVQTVNEMQLDWSKFTCTTCSVAWRIIGTSKERLN
jgi:hypothetical protein